MFTHCVEHATQLYDARSVQVECINCGTSAWGYADNESVVLIPGEMFMPELLSWMIARNHLSAHSIASLCLDILVIVISLAG